MKAVRITAMWCMSCLVMKSRYDRMFKAYDIDEIIDLDYDLDHVEQYQAGRILPVVIIYDKDEEKIRIIGEKSKKQLKKIFDSINQ
jgi:hypothetical protein